MNTEREADFRLPSLMRQNSPAATKRTGRRTPPPGYGRQNSPSVLRQNGPSVTGGNRRLSLAALNNRDFVVWAGHFVSLLSVIGGWGGVLPPHFGRKKAGDLFQISCSVCRCVSGGYLVVKVRDKLTRCV